MNTFLGLAAREQLELDDGLRLFIKEQTSYQSAISSD
jgi:hypothetical protein